MLTIRAWPSRCLAVAILALLMFATPSLVSAQVQATTGLVRGAVADSSGAPIAGATVLLRNRETNAERSITTNPSGVFVASLLRVGTYDISVRAIGYAMATRKGIVVRLGEASRANFALGRQAIQLQDLSVSANRDLTGQSPVASTTQFDTAVTSGLPNNGRNLLALTLLTPNVAIVQGPDGDVLSIGGQRGIHNNVSVDGADFNNPFFGEQRGGQRPAFTFNLDAVQEMVVVSQGANAEFGRSSGGFVNVLTKSGTNQLKGSAHYFGKSDAISGSPSHGNTTFAPDFTQHQFGFTLGGPIKKDKAFFFLAYDQQVFRETKQKVRTGIDPALKAWTDTAFAGVFAGEFGSIRRTNDANALLAKFDFRLSNATTATLKYNYTNSRQENGTFDVDNWGRSANGLERDYSHAVNGSLNSALSSAVANELRFQFAREDRPRAYNGPKNKATGRPFPDTDISFTGFRIGMPFFLPVQSHDTRFQVVDNISLVKGKHFFKAGGEFNRTEEVQTFIGFGNGRMAFSSVNGFLNYVRYGNGYVECSGGTTSTTGACASGSITGPVILYLQQAGVGGKTVEQAGTQSIPVTELALFLQDSWKPKSNLTIDYGLRWETQQLPDPQTPASQVFFAPLIGKTVTNSTGTYTFPSDGTIHSDSKMFQPRFGLAWDPSNDGQAMFRASAGIYYARIPGLNLASIRSTNGSIGQTLFRNSELTGILGAPPQYGQLLPSPSGGPFQPGVFVMDKNFRNPQTMSASFSYDRAIGTSGLHGSLSYTYANTKYLTRFVNRNDAVFGKPWATGLAGGNGIGDLTVVEATGKSRFHGFTVALSQTATPGLQYGVNYTLGFDKSDDDNERDPFSFRYARANDFAPEYNWSDRDQRHRLNGWLLAKLPASIYANNRVSFYSAQPVSEKCINNAASGQRAVSQGDRVCANGTILPRNTLRKDNAYFTWDLRLSHPFRTGRNGTLEAVVEVFNVTGTDNFKDAASTGLFLNFDGTIRSGLGDPRQVQAGLRYVF